MAGIADCSENKNVAEPRTPEASRALAEAEARRKTQALVENAAAPEIGGPRGPDPVRFGDWERGGIASDF